MGRKRYSERTRHWRATDKSASATINNVFGVKQPRKVRKASSHRRQRRAYSGFFSWLHEGSLPAYFKPTREERRKIRRCQRLGQKAERLFTEYDRTCRGKEGKQKCFVKQQRIYGAFSTAYYCAMQTGMYDF